MNLKITFVLIFVALFSANIKADQQANFVALTNALWSSFGLSNPTSLQNCWNATTSSYFFGWFNSTYLVFNDIMAGNLSKYVLIDSVNQLQYLQQSGGNWRCTVATNDFLNLITKLNFPNPSQFQNTATLYNAIWAWASAYPNIVQADLVPVINAINSNDFSTAGSALSKVLKDITYTSDFNNQQAAYSIIGWYNGWFLGLNLPFPATAAQCFAQVPVDKLVPLKTFYDGLFKSIYQKKVLETYLLVKNYYNNAGKTAYSQVPKTLWDCLNACADTKALKTILSFGMDPYDQCYTTTMYAFINANYDNAYEYHAILNKIQSAILPDYFDATTYSYKQLLKDINIYSKC